MPARLAPERRLRSTLTYHGADRAITARLADGDRLIFDLEDFGTVGSLELMPLVWQAIRSNPAGAKHPLQPRTCKAKRPYHRDGQGVKALAKQYGVSPGTISKWRAASAPVHNPDAMGDYIWTLPRRGGIRRKVVRR